MRQGRDFGFLSWKDGIEGNDLLLGVDEWNGRLYRRGERLGEDSRPRKSTRGGRMEGGSSCDRNAKFVAEVFHDQYMISCFLRRKSEVVIF